MNVSKFVEYRKKIVDNCSKVIVGKEDIISLVLTCFVCSGHVLLEDIPGTGKTMLLRSFAKTIGGDFKRIQFTPDLLPSDLTGINFYNQKSGEFEFRQGPLFSNIILADEINRTSPKTQSALLEVMEEKQVTVEGVTRKLMEPFIVIATENPEGSAGTQLLPESQLDRFMICIRMGYPTVEEEMEILKRRQGKNPVDAVRNVINGPMIVAMQQEVSQIFLHDVIYEYIANLAKATREHEMVAMGMSPRGSVALAAMSRAAAWLAGREYVLPEDVKLVFASTSAHRIRLNTKAKVGRVKPDEVLQQILARVQEPTVRRK